MKKAAKRIQRLEYYSALNLLESEVASLTIPNQNNPTIAAFKNGFFVDPFNSYTVANYNDGEFKSEIDTLSSKLVPLQQYFNLDLVYNQTGSTNVTKNGDLVSLPYTEVTLVNQPIANKERTLVEQYWSYNGKMTVVPRVDNFFDIAQRSTTSININVADPLIALQNAVNRELAVATAATKLINTTYGDTSSVNRMITGMGVDENGNWAEYSYWTGINDFSRTVTQTYQNSYRQISAAPTYLS